MDLDLLGHHNGRPVEQSFLCDASCVLLHPKDHRATKMIEQLFIRLLFLVTVFLQGTYLVEAGLDSTTKVYDNVVSKETAEWLHELCRQWKDEVQQYDTDNGKNENIPNLKDRLFEFPLQNPEKHPTMQRFLNELIWEMLGSDETNKYYVEYWTRQEWHHILAHQDMDEGWEKLLRRERQECLAQNRKDCNAKNNFRHPFTGQVLYLSIGNNVRGPTVIFDAQNGNDLMTNHTTSMISVPAVTGRLLRFPGDRLHAVPRPADVYWTLDQSKNHIHTKDYERSVLLFNLWKTDTMLVDKVLDCGDGKFPSDRRTCYENEKRAGKNKPEPENCKPRKVWQTVPIVHTPKPPPPLSLVSKLWEYLVPSWESFQVPLSGDEIKRGISGYVARMVSHYDDSEKQNHPARDNVREAILPKWTEIEADERFMTVGEL